MIDTISFQNQFELLLKTYQLSLTHSQLTLSSQLISVFDEMMNHPSLSTLTKIIEQHQALFLTEETGYAFIQELKNLCKGHQTYLYWKKIKNTLYAGHFKHLGIEKYAKAQALGVYLPPGIPSSSIKPRLSVFKAYRDALKSEYQDHADAIITHLDKISWRELKSLVRKLAAQLNQFVIEKKYQQIYFFHRGQAKSEYWILQLIFPFLNFEVQGVIEISNNFNCLDDENQNALEKLKNALSSNTGLLFVDDGSYSGTQCIDHIHHVLLRLEHLLKIVPKLFHDASIELVFGFAYTTSHATALIDNALTLLLEHQLITSEILPFFKGVHLFTEKTILSLQEIDWGTLKTDYEIIIAKMVQDEKNPRPLDRLTMVYTDWRTPDGFSSITSFFKGAPPITLCLDEYKEVLLEKKSQHEFYSENQLIPLSFEAPYPQKNNK